MAKDFSEWHLLKTNIENNKGIPLFREQEIWWSSVGLNIGDEEDGKNHFFERPVLVLKKFNQSICWALPLSSIVKDGKYYHTFQFNEVVCTIMLSQMRILSAKRFIRRIGKLSDFQFEVIKEKVIDLLK